MHLDWETLASSWLSSRPTASPPTAAEIDAWLDSVPSTLPPDPRPFLHQRVLSIHHLLHGTAPSSQAMKPEDAEPPKWQFQRTDLWRPVYSWLESLDTDVLIKAKDVNNWLAENTVVREKLFSRHSKYHLMHYIQKMHTKLLQKRGKLQTCVQLRTRRASMKIFNRGIRSKAIKRQIAGNFSSLQDREISLLKKDEALLRYELLTDLQNQLTSLLSKHKEINKSEISSSMMYSHRDEGNASISFNCYRENGDSTKRAEGTSLVLDAEKLGSSNQTNLRSLECLPESRKRKRTPAIATPSWCYCEALLGSNFGEASLECIEQEMLQATLHASLPGNSVPVSNKSIVKCLQGRERCSSWSSTFSHGSYAGRDRKKWIPFFEGWNSLERQYEGHALWFQRRCYSSWVPAWCAYTSSVDVAQPYARQGVQKVLDVRFHPDGLAQLICSSNEPPNELLLYNLHSGRGVELTGHNCQIQAIEFAVKGASIVSCGGSLVKVWDSTTGSCLFTFGLYDDAQTTVGHVKKINAMTVNRWQSCLVATCGGLGDGKLLLWNALTGQLAADLNVHVRTGNVVIPSIEAMEFCNQNILVCGTDSSSREPAVLQLWDIEASQSCQSLVVNDSYITSLKASPDCNTIITGAGNGEVSLFDVRTCGEIFHLSVGTNYEVTSVSFSSCGTYFHASSTSNSALVWDTRLMPTHQKGFHEENPTSINMSRALKSLHCLSHGKQMPTAEHAGQLPGYVDEGDQGINDARWLQKEPILVTVSGDGSVAMWDVTLGQPCVRHLFSHNRCVNTVAIAPNDDYLCTGGDDQKVVLYHNTRGTTHAKWRLTHPLLKAE